MELTRVPFIVKIYLIFLAFAYKINTIAIDICESELCDCLVDFANCRNRNISTIKETLTVPDFISRIDFSDNEISKLEDLDIQVLNPLKILDLSSNALEYLTPSSFLKFNQSLESLSLKNNLIKSVHQQTFENLLLLEKLTLSFNQISELPDRVFDNLTALRALDLSYNPIARFKETTFMNLRALEELNLSSLHLEQISEEVLDWNLSISYLDLSNNRFQSVPNKALWYLRNTLKVLKLSENYFETLPAGSFFGLEFLEELYLEQLLSLKKIDAFAFKDLKSFQTIRLRYLPKIYRLDERAFHISETSDGDNLCPVRDFTIEFSTLSYLPENLLIWKDLRYANLQSNRWICNCNMKWIKSSPLENLTDNTIFCLGYGPNKGKNTFYLSEEDFTCITFTMETKGGVIAIFIIFVIAIIVSFSTVSILVYRRNGWLLRPPKRSYDKIDSSLNTITIFDRSSVISTPGNT